ncbi:hypothetical protein ES703_39302 [subsurface metagenome]
MTSFKARVAQKFLLIKAAKEFKKEIEKAGLDNLTILANAGTSIVGTYLNGCSPEEKARIRRDLATLLQMGITGDMLLDELVKQLPGIAPIIAKKTDYKKTEIQNLERFVKEG